MDDEDGRCLLDVICDPEALNDFLHGSETHLDTDDLLDGSTDPASSFFSGVGGHVPEVPPVSQLSVTGPAVLPSGSVDLDFLEDDILASSPGGGAGGSRDGGSNGFGGNHEPCDILLQSLAEANITEQSLQEAEAEADLSAFGLTGLTQVVPTLTDPGITVAGEAAVGVDLGGPAQIFPVQPQGSSATAAGTTADMLGSVLAHPSLQLQPQVMNKPISVQPFMQQVGLGNVTLQPISGLQTLPNGSPQGHLGIGQIQVVGQPTVMTINQSGQPILTKAVGGYQLQTGTEMAAPGTQAGLGSSVLSQAGGILIQGGKAPMGSPVLNGAGIGSTSNSGGAINSSGGLVSIGGTPVTAGMATPQQPHAQGSIMQNVIIQRTPTPIQPKPSQGGSIQPKVFKQQQQPQPSPHSISSEAKVLGVQQGQIPVSTAQNVTFLTSKAGTNVVLSAPTTTSAFSQAVFRQQVPQVAGKPVSVQLVNQSGSIVLQGQNPQFLLPQLSSGQIIASHGPGGQLIANQILASNQNLNLSQVLTPQGHPAHILSGPIQLQSGQVAHPTLFQMPVSLAQSQTQAHPLPGHTQAVIQGMPVQNSLAMLGQVDTLCPAVSLHPAPQQPTSTLPSNSATTVAQCQPGEGMTILGSTADQTTHSAQIPTAASVLAVQTAPSVAIAVPSSSPSTSAATPASSITMTGAMPPQTQSGPGNLFVTPQGSSMILSQESLMFLQQDQQHHTETVQPLSGCVPASVIVSSSSSSGPVPHIHESLSAEARPSQTSTLSLGPTSGAAMVQQLPATGAQPQLMIQSASPAQPTTVQPMQPTLSESTQTTPLVVGQPVQSPHQQPQSRPSSQPQPQSRPPSRSCTPSSMPSLFIMPNQLGASPQNTVPVQPQIQTQIQPQIQAQIQAQVHPQIQPQMPSQIQPHVQTQIHSQLQTQLQPQIQTQLQPQIQIQAQAPTPSQSVAFQPDVPPSSLSPKPPQGTPVQVQIVAPQGVASISSSVSHQVSLQGLTPEQQQTLQLIGPQLQSLSNIAQLTPQQKQLRDRLQQVQQNIILQSKQQSQTVTSNQYITNQESLPQIVTSSTGTGASASFVPVLQPASVLVKTPVSVANEVKVYLGTAGTSGVASVNLAQSVESKPGILGQVGGLSLAKGLRIQVSNTGIPQLAAPQTVSIVQTQSGGSTRQLVMEPSKEARLLEQLRKQQGSVLHPDYSSPFRSYEEMLHRLLPYHLYQGTASSPGDYRRVDEEFESVSSQLLKRTQAMVDKYRLLLFEESKRLGPSAEMVMIDRMFIQEEKITLNQDKLLAKEKPDEYIAHACTLEATPAVPPIPPPVEPKGAHASLSTPATSTAVPEPVPAATHIGPTKMVIKHGGGSASVTWSSSVAPINKPRPSTESTFSRTADDEDALPQRSSKPPIKTYEARQRIGLKLKIKQEAGLSKVVHNTALDPIHTPMQTLIEPAEDSKLSFSTAAPVSRTSPPPETIPPTLPVYTALESRIQKTTAPSIPSSASFPSSISHPTSSSQMNGTLEHHEGSGAKRNTVGVTTQPLTCRLPLRKTYREKVSPHPFPTGGNCGGVVTSPQVQPPALQTSSTESRGLSPTSKRTVVASVKLENVSNQQPYPEEKSFHGSSRKTHHCSEGDTDDIQGKGESRLASSRDWQMPGSASPSGPSYQWDSSLPNKRRKSDSADVDNASFSSGSPPPDDSLNEHLQSAIDSILNLQQGSSSSGGGPKIGAISAQGAHASHQSHIQRPMAASSASLSQHSQLGGATRRGQNGNLVSRTCR